MAAQIQYGANQAPGGGNPFFAGLEELWNAPGSFLEDSVPGVDSGYKPAANKAGGAQPGGGSAFLAGVEELFQDPAQGFKDLGSSTSTITLWLSLAVVGVLGLAYISHKAL